MNTNNTKQDIDPLEARMRRRARLDRAASIRVFATAPHWEASAAAVTQALVNDLASGRSRRMEAGFRRRFERARKLTGEERAELLHRMELRRLAQGTMRREEDQPDPRKGGRRMGPRPLPVRENGFGNYVGERVVGSAFQERIFSRATMR